MTSFRDVVAKHHDESEAILVAAREPCVSIAFNERQNVHGRNFRIVHVDDLDQVEVGRSWIMAVLLCPGDDTRAIAAWATSQQADVGRILFYLHTDTDARSSFADWHGAGLRIPATWTIGSWREMHKHFGAAWNVRVFDDFR